MSEDRQGTDAATVRGLVASAYGRLVSERQGGGEDRPACSSCSPRAEAIGYSAEDLSAVPAGAEVPTFGCGNPLAFSEVQEGQTVVDLGSGAGLDLLIAAEQVGPSGRVIGVDMTEEMVATSRRNIAAAGRTNVEVRQGLIEELPVESGTADWVISNCVINLSPEKGRVFAEIARALRPGGRMLVSDIVVEDLPRWVRESAAALSACVGGAVSEESYVAGLGEAGLADVEVRQRHVYDSATLRALIASPEVAGEGCCSGEGCGDAGRLSDELGGKVASIKVFARKPSTGA